MLVFQGCAGGIVRGAIRAGEEDTVCTHECTRSLLFAHKSRGPSLPTYTVCAGGYRGSFRALEAASVEVGADMFEGAGWTDLVEM